MYPALREKRQRNFHNKTKQKENTEKTHTTIIEFQVDILPISAIVMQHVPLENKPQILNR
jgi:hypothetical protein